LPDRNSLALVIKDWLHSFGRNGFARAGSQRMRMDREPHIGEYDAKTNAICDFSQIPGTPKQAQNGPAPSARRCECRFYCPWFFST
jgi:hypothetical protein